ncbi:MAG TPA: sterol desaturase family protein [Candidatus Eisenbacteria bacterium]|nr:sterol desaturase family protein [Candidatus Eisenbacteria bacterium]
MIDIILAAVPFFILFIVLELLSLWFAPDDDEVGYDARDTATSLAMGLGSVVVGLSYKALAVATYSAAYLLTPLRIDPGNPAAWVVIFFLDDLCYYWFHRAHHEIRVLWASHVVHHSSQRYNFSTALRQTWTPFGALPFWLPLALLGFPPWMILLQQSINLLYQFFLHTERVDRLPRPVELVMNTPSHHRVHHGSNPGYLDRNYGGILILWDRLFRTFEPEGERVVYGLTKNLRSNNPFVVAFHEYVAIARDLRASASWRSRLSFVARGPGWRPEVG